MSPVLNSISIVIIGIVITSKVISKVIKSKVISKVKTSKVISKVITSKVINKVIKSKVINKVIKSKVISKVISIVITSNVVISIVVMSFSLLLNQNGQAAIRFFNVIPLCDEIVLIISRTTSEKLYLTTNLQSSRIINQPNQQITSTTLMLFNRH